MVVMNLSAAIFILGVDPRDVARDSGVARDSAVARDWSTFVSHFRARTLSYFRIFLKEKPLAYCCQLENKKIQKVTFASVASLKA